MLKGGYFKHQLIFNFPAGTSRGILRKKNTWFIQIRDSLDPDIFGIGECGPLPGLSPDPIDKIEDQIKISLKKLQDYHQPQDINQAFDLASSIVPDNFPSLRFAIESALMDLLNKGIRRIFGNGFFDGKISVPINGLIWMNEKSEMIRQAKEKIEEGFSCIKMKIGAINFEEELDVLKLIRTQPNMDITLRVDANGAFQPDEVLQKMDILSEFGIHSIEQPIIPGKWEEMSEISKKSSIAIALDEELIGMSRRKEELLTTIQPKYIVLKPTLLGGFQETIEWINLAEKNGIGWWITSMLESNIGLNAIAQFSSEMDPGRIHGLGTGKLYSNNIGSPLTIRNGEISYLLNKNWDYSIFPDKN